MAHNLDNFLMTDDERDQIFGVNTKVISKVSIYINNKNCELLNFHLSEFNQLDEYKENNNENLNVNREIEMEEEINSEL